MLLAKTQQAPLDCVQPFLHSHQTFSFFRFLTRLYSVKLKFFLLAFISVVQKKKKVRHIFGVNAEKLLGWLAGTSFSSKALELRGQS